MKEKEKKRKRKEKSLERYRSKMRDIVLLLKDRVKSSVDGIRFYC